MVQNLMLIETHPTLPRFDTDLGDRPTCPAINIVIKNKKWLVSFTETAQSTLKS